MQLYNTLGRKKQEFTPMDNKTAKIYTCGPTVYLYAHIGNWASFIFADLLVRSLKKIGGWKVKWVTNITDVGHLTEDDVGMGDTGEDKMSKTARKEGRSPEEVANFYIEDYLKDWKRLRLSEPDIRPKATKYMKEIIAFVDKLVHTNYAYETSDGVYFELDKFQSYGTLSGNKLENLQAGSRIKINEDKKSPHDFALWKKAIKQHAKALQTWDSPWGKGFPGWHIECSAMSEKIFGHQKNKPILDIHTGGEDHIFPHHECEIAQTGARHPETNDFCGNALSKFWMHRKFIMVDEEKMSKSKGNFYRVEDLTNEGYDPLDFRYLVLSVHYRTQMNFTWKALEGARVARLKIIDFWQRLNQFIPYQKDNMKNDFPRLQAEDFVEAINDDLNTPKALGILHDTMREANIMIEKQLLTLEQQKQLQAFIGLFNSIFDIFPDQPENIPVEIHKLAKERLLAKQNRDYEQADKLRNKILDLGWEVRDVKDGYELRKL
ncbi:MAG: cysteine--tRNA ligase [Patescibacteria group bacterium]|nr:cysteine--tRNA ligase [Patescibacteria group bacterium]